MVHSMYTVLHEAIKISCFANPPIVLSSQGTQGDNQGTIHCLGWHGERFGS